MVITFHFLATFNFIYGPLVDLLAVGGAGDRGRDVTRIEGRKRRSCWDGEGVREAERSGKGGERNRRCYCWTGVTGHNTWRPVAISSVV